MSFEQVTFTNHKNNCRFILSSKAGVAWGDAILHRAVVTIHRAGEEWARASIQLQGTVGDWAVPQIFEYTEKDREWWPIILHIFSVDGCFWADLLAHRLCEVFHYQRLVEEEAAWVAELESHREETSRTPFRPVAIVRPMPRTPVPVRRPLREVLAERRRAGPPQGPL